MKRVAILQSNYIPWKGYFDIISSVDEFVVYDDVQFTKNDWRNRNRIKTRSGVQWLSIPVRQERLDQTIRETKVADERWPTKHWNALAQNYARAPHFKAFAPVVEQMYADARGLEFLSDINLLFIRRLCFLLDIRTKLTPSTAYAMRGGRMVRLVDICRQAGADTYLSGPAARNYLDEKEFSVAGISVEWMNYAGYMPYEQLYPPFEHGVTILDLLFHCGVHHKKYTRSCPPWNCP